MSGSPGYSLRLQRLLQTMERMKPSSLTWPQVVFALGLAFMLLTSITIMALNKVDVVGIMTALVSASAVVAAMFGVSLHNKVDRVETMTNGRLTEVMDQNKALVNKVETLALAVNPLPPTEGS